MGWESERRDEEREGKIMNENAKKKKKKSVRYCLNKISLCGSHSFYIIYNNATQNCYLKTENYSLRVL